MSKKEIKDLLTRLSNVQEHYILSVLYGFDSDNIVVYKPSKIIKETKCFYYTESRNRYSKEDAVGKAVCKSTKAYPYIEVTLIDGTEEEARKILADWFIQMSKTMLTRQTV